MIHPLIEDSGWFDKVRKKHQKPLSEIDTLLRGVVRFFNISNLFTEDTGVAGRNFRAELKVLRDTIYHLLGLIETVIPERYKNAFWFQKYAEQSLLSDHDRDRLRQNLIRQESPEQSLLLMYDTLVNIKVIIQGLLSADRVSYSEFKHLGDILERQMRENIYFGPFRKEIDPEFDRISNRMVSRAVRSISDRNERKVVSTLVLYLFRCLRFIGHINPNAYESVTLSVSLVILVLLNSEIRSIIEYIEGTGNRIENGDLRSLLDSIGFQMRMESKRVFRQELRNVLGGVTLARLKGKIEASQGILRNMIEQCILQIIKFYQPDIKGEEIFPGFVTRLEQSLKLRDDVYTLWRIVDILETNFKDRDKRRSIFEALRAYMMYFQSFTFRLLRHDDYEEFDRFFNKFLAISAERILEMDDEKFLHELHRFRIFLETTVKMVSQREELKDRQIDTEKIDAVISQFMPMYRELNQISSSGPSE